MADERRESGTFRCTDAIRFLLIGESVSRRLVVVNASSQARFAYCDNTDDALFELGDGRPCAVLFECRAGSFGPIQQDFCRSARSLSNEVVLIAVTEGPATEARLEAFDAGADDCIGYDTDFREVLARVQAIVRRRRKAPPAEGLEQRAMALAIAFGLSARERETLGQLARGVHSKQIGDALGCEYSTVRTHLRRICKKLGCSGTREAIVRFFAYDLSQDYDVVARVPKQATRQVLAQKSK